jgi:3-hydroxyacyl-[acyl-carrier-protein] dehydratase
VSAPTADRSGTTDTPFAAPLNAVDRIEDDGGPTVIAIKHIVATDPYLAGHYPDFTIYPGVFSIETVYQAARAAALRRRPPGATVALAGIASVSFSAPLLPGDTLEATLRLEQSTSDPEVVSVKARCRRGDGQTSARITLRLRVRDENTGDRADA